MYYNNKVFYTVNPGDNLFIIAKRYNTTIPAILSENPGLNAYNLREGQMITISPGYSTNPGYSVYTPYDRIPNTMSSYSQASDQFSRKKLNLSNEMRYRWEQHIMWTRMLIISITQDLNDESAVTDRLLQNPKDIAKIYDQYYGGEVASRIASLLTEHLAIGKELITASKNKDTAKAEDANKHWYANADETAQAFASINPYYKQDEVKKMLYKHLDLTKNEVSARLADKYTEDIAAYDQVEQEALEMADYFTQGIISQVPHMF